MDMRFIRISVFNKNECFDRDSDVSGTPLRASRALTCFIGPM